MWIHVKSFRCVTSRIHLDLWKDWKLLLNKWRDSHKNIFVKGIMLCSRQISIHYFGRTGKVKKVKCLVNFTTDTLLLNDVKNPVYTDKQFLLIKTRLLMIGKWVWPKSSKNSHYVFYIYVLVLYHIYLLYNYLFLIILYTLFFEIPAK